jgi:threonine dehydratase
MLLGLDDIERARARIGGRVHATPVMSSATVGDELGVRLYLKAELFQRTGSFKPRGVFNKRLSMDPAVRSRGLVSLSAGNHAAALAYGATAVGATATIVMPAAAMRSKVEATRRYGGEVVQTAGSLLEACLALQQQRDLTLVHPFDDWRSWPARGRWGWSSSGKSRAPAWWWSRSAGAASSPASPRPSSSSTPLSGSWEWSRRARTR